MNEPLQVYTPLISVIMPAYNAGDFIADSIESVLSQTYPNLELVIIDDGSTDGTSKIASRFTSDYAGKIRYLQQKNDGPASARNKGILSAQGEWIAFIDSDDFWTNDHLAQLISKVAMDSTIDLVYGSKLFVDHNKSAFSAEFQPDYAMPEGWIFAEMFRNNLMSTPSVLVRKKKLLNVGLFDVSQSLRVAEDYDLWLRITATSKVASVPQLKFYCRRHFTNTTLNSSNRSRGLITAIDNAVMLINNGMVDDNNVLDGINMQKRVRGLYENAVLAAYYTSHYPEMRSYIVEGLSRRIITLRMMEKLLLSMFPKRILAKIKKMVKG